MKYMGWSREQFDTAYPEDIEVLLEIYQEELDRQEQERNNDF